MKQHIYPEQAREISKEQFYSLFDELVDRDDWANYHHRKLTIGKLIEVIKSENICYIKHLKNWKVCIFDKDLEQREFESINLCDSLWGAVKELL